MVKSGKFNERVTFKTLTQTAIPDAYGNVGTGVATNINRSAQILENTGREQIRLGALSDTNIARLRVRSDTATRAINSKDQVVARGKTWAIKNIIQLDSKNTILEFLIESGVTP